MPMTPEELALLTEDERAGLEEDVTDDDVLEGETDDDENEDAGEEQDDDTSEEEEGDDETPPAKDDDKPAEEEPEEEPDVRQPLIKAEVPADVEAKLAAIDTKEDEIAQKFDDGDLTSAEYRAEVRKLEKERSDIDWQVKKAELSNEAAQQQAVNAWYDSVKDFLGKHPEIKGSKLKYEAFDAVVRQVTADEANHKLSDAKQLDMAYKIWAEELGITVAEAKDTKPGKKARVVPPTLAKVPASDIETTDDGQYANLNRLFNSSKPTDVMRAEEMLASMSEAEQNKFLAS